jgi:RNA polymerase sigma factor (sigma-70 family)
MPSTLPPDVARLLDASDPQILESAWAAFLRTYNSVLLRAARAIGPEYDGAMDRYAHVLEQLRQDDFRRLRRCAASPPDDFSVWLAVVARRLSLDHYRGRYGRPRPSRSGTTGARQTRRRVVDLLASGTEMDRVPDVREGPIDEAVASRERASALRAAIERLSARDRLLLRFRFDEECTAAEIGRLMAFPTMFHVYRRLNAVLGQLRRALERDGFDGA